ncbi:MAG: tRNA ((37)-N1)-methyltransferase TrmD [Rickettsiales bacterium]|jgi:tRNA (guanine37-N1)-methyltransferase|nr:tRNA ((37)-N1)-methyltransferase TrmD [Rickettsiales bacterium]
MKNSSSPEVSGKGLEAERFLEDPTRRAGVYSKVHEDSRTGPTTKSPADKHLTEAPLWHVTLFTLFPEMFPGMLGFSLAGQGLEKGIWKLDTVDIKNYGIGKHHQVDDSPFGGGAGMLMRADVLEPAIEKYLASSSEGSHTPPLLLYMSPRGKLLTQGDALAFTKQKQVGIVCGRFEGIDERVLEHYGIQEVSIGDVVLSGGEPAAQVLIDACVRLLPGVLGAEETLEEESFCGRYQHLLEYPHYTRPRIWKEREVPEVLLSGDHKKIADWRYAQAQKLTRERRTDLWKLFEASTYLQNN